MASLSQTIKSADWKTEKHVPVIELPAEIKAGEEFKVKVSLGKGVPHPNTIEHHIAWISVFFQPEGAETAFSDVATAHTQIVDQVVEVDDELMELYLEQGEELEPEQLHDERRRAYVNQPPRPVLET